jgi:DNA binding domain, excisionase family
MTVEQVATALNISRNLAYDLIRQGVIPSIRLGRIIRVPRSRLEDWIARDDERGQLSTSALGSSERLRIDNERRGNR